MQNKKTQVVLAINPGAKYLGIAVLEAYDLRDWRVKTLKGEWSDEKMKAILAVVSGYVKKYAPTVIVLKKLHPSRRSLNLVALCEEIRGLAKENGIRVHEYSIQDVERFYSPIDKINKKELAEIISIEYPVLFHELEREKGNRNKYFIRMFEAVAFGVMCFSEIDMAHHRTN